MSGRGGRAAVGGGAAGPTEPAESRTTLDMKSERVDGPAFELGLVERTRLESA